MGSSRGSFIKVSELDGSFGMDVKKFSAFTEENQQELSLRIVDDSMAFAIQIQNFISANADRTYVILVAQVFNGCLLPFFSTLLLLCLNDEQFMGERPQPLWANIFLVTSVFITMFLANNVVLTKIFGAVCSPSTSWCSLVSLRLSVA